MQYKINLSPCGLVGKASGSWPVGTGYESRVGALFDPHETFTASWQLANRVVKKKTNFRKVYGLRSHVVRHSFLSPTVPFLSKNVGRKRCRKRLLWNHVRPAAPGGRNKDEYSGGARAGIVLPRIAPRRRGGGRPADLCTRRQAGVFVQGAGGDGDRATGPARLLRSAPSPSPPEDTPRGSYFRGGEQGDERTGSLPRRSADEWCAWLSCEPDSGRWNI